MPQLTVPYFLDDTEAFFLIEKDQKKKLQVVVYTTTLWLTVRSETTHYEFQMD